MSRLTKRVMDEALLKDVEFVACKALCESMDKYNHPCDMCPIDWAIKKLAHYEDLEEQGRLIELPCKVGDTVYDIADGTAYKTKVLQFVMFEDHLACRTVSSFPDVEVFGTRVFTTKAEAEQKLAEMKGE